MKMADKGLVYLLRRCTFHSCTTSAVMKAASVSSSPKCPSSSSSSFASAATAAAGTDEEGEKEKTTKENEGWLTLPPFSFSSSIDPSSLGKRIFGRRPSDSTQQEAAVEAAQTTTALKWVLRCCPHLPKCLVHKLFRLRQVRRKSTDPSVEGHIQQHRLSRVSAKDAMNSGDQIYLPITVQKFPSEKTDHLCNEDETSYINSLELYKDPAIIALNKPPGMPVQGGIGISRSLDMLAATLLRYDYSEAPRLVHRLDRDSSGILVMGRSQTSAAVLHSIFCEKTSRASSHLSYSKDGGNTERVLVKKYWALVIGTPKRSKGLISAPLARVVMDNGKSERITIVHDTRIPSAQHALTEYKVIKSSDHGYTWLELQPLTGRKHQLRVHCAEALGTPIVGDYKYGWKSHRKWEPLHWESESRKLPPIQKLPFGLDLDSGSISEKQPRLHLHCRQMILPNVSLALQLQSSTHQDLSKLERLNLVAPLPSYMQRSWDILSS